MERAPKGKSFKGKYETVFFFERVFFFWGGGVSIPIKPLEYFLEQHMAGHQTIHPVS